MEKLISIVSRVLFIGSFVLAGIAVLEKLANIFGYTVSIILFSPWRLLEISAIALLFVVALQLREIKSSLKRQMMQ